MSNDGAALAELEKPIRQNLQRFLSRELEREYQPKQRNKALKLRPEALLGWELHGEQLKAQVLDGGKTFRVDITFPLFDLGSDFTLVQCSCSRDLISLEPLRCHHMYFVEQKILGKLDEVEHEAEAQQNPLDVWESIWNEASSSEDLIDEERWVLIFDRLSWQVSLEKQARARYGDEGKAPWRRIDRRDLDAWRSELGTEGLGAVLSRGGGVIEREIFELLALQLESEFPSPLALVLDCDDGRDLSFSTAQWQIQIEAVSSGGLEGYWVRPSLGGLPLRRLVAGKGLVSWSDAAPHILYLVRLEARAERFITQLLEQQRPVPEAEKERMLSFLERLDPRLLDLAAGAEEASKPVEEMQGVLRLTPFTRGGMKVELLLQIAPQLVVRVGEGAERLRDFAAKGPSKQRLCIWERDFSEERRLARKLSRGLGLDHLPEAETNVFIAYNDERALELMREAEAYKAQNPLLIEWPASLQKGPKPYALTAELDKAALNVSVGDKKDWFQVEGWIELDEGRKLSLREMLAAIRMQKKYIQLPDGRWALISEHLRQRLEPLNQAIEFSADDREGSCTIDLATLSSPEASSALANFPFTEASQAFWRQVHKAKGRREKISSLPPGLKAELRPYQLEGFRWLLHLCESELGACLADDMGLGKTLQTLTLLLKKAGGGPSLVIAPSSLTYNWAAEARRFCPELRITLLRELDDRGQGRTFEAGEVVVASYGLIMRYAEGLGSQRWNIIVLDEAQQIKNAHTKTAQAVRILNGRWKLGLTGTPIENRLSELWSLFHTLSPGLFGEWERFRRSYVFPIERDRSAEAQESLRRKISPFVLRRLKKDYLTELPEKTEVDLWVDLSPEEKDFYEALRGEAIDKIGALDPEGDPAAEAKQRMQVLAALSKLRQAACHRRLVDSEWDKGSTKIDILRERLSELSEAGHAGLVFSQFTRFLNEIAAALEADGRKILYLDGQTPVSQRLELVERFQAGGYDAFLISLKAGGTGLNLTRASYVFHMDPWWNPAVEMQATDRAYRMGQKQAVTVYKLRARETIEEVIHAVHGEKKELVENLLAGRDPAEAWSWETVWAMLQGRAKKLTPDGVRPIPRGRREMEEKQGPSSEGARL